MFTVHTSTKSDVFVLRRRNLKGLYNTPYKRGNSRRSGLMAEASDASSTLLDSASEPRESSEYDRTTSRTEFLTVSPSVWAVVRLLIVQMLEIVAFIVITYNTAVYIEAYMTLQLAEPSPSLVTTANLALATMRILAPFYGLLSDAKVGQFKLLISCFTTYCLGASLICGSAFALGDPANRETLPKVLYYSGLAIVLFSAAGIRATLIPFMLEQLSGDEHQRNKHLTPFVSWSYFAINVGAEIAILLGGYLQTLPVPFSHFKSMDRRSFPGFFWMYLLALCSLCLALLILILSRNKFRRNCPSIFYKPSIKAIFRAAFCKKTERQHYNVETLRFYEHEANDETQRTEQKRKEDTRRLADNLPLSLAMILYFTIQSQAEDTFVLQGEHLNHDKLEHLLIPPADLTFAFEPLAIIVAVPVMLFCVKRIYERTTDTPLYVTSRIRWGMILAFLSCALATFIECYRDSHFKGGWPKLRHSRMNTKNIAVCFSDIPIYSQVPQYVLMGISEVLAEVSFMEFVLSSTPHQFRSTMFGMVYFLTGLGRYVGILLKVVIEHGAHKGFYPPFQSTNKTIECDIEKEKSYKPYIYFMILTCLIAINVVFYLIYEYRFRKYVRVARLPRKKTTKKRTDQHPTD